MTEEEKDLAKQITELKSMVSMLFNKINVLHQLLPRNEKIDQAFETIEKGFIGLPESKADYKSKRQT